ncbi:hypothetical protein FRC01_005082 [Tulasnella sp. 417]|nr:hypothetical protein FRC01_005082 [Tulasnella sp. 417]
MTVGAFEIWFSQPNEENQQAAELFGLVLCRVLLQCSREDGRWKDLTEESLPLSNKLGKVFLESFIFASSKNSPIGTTDDRRILDISIHFALLKAGIDLEQFRWMTDQASTAQFVCSLDRATLSYMFDDCNCWKHLINLTLSAFDIWYSQPNKEKQEVAESFGLILCRAILQCPKEDKKWKEITEISLLGSKGSGEMFMQTLIAASSMYSLADPDDDQRILHLSVMFTADKKQIKLNEFQWAKSSHLLDSHGPAADAMLRAWALIVFGVGAARMGSSLTGQLPFMELLESRTFLSSEPSRSGTPSTSRNGLISSAALIDTVADVLIDDLTSLTGQDEKWKSKGRTFKACIIRMLLWIWRNHPYRNPSDWKRSEFLASSCRLWAPLEKEVGFSTTGSFGDEDKPLTPDDLKGVAEFAQWVQTQTLDQDYIKDREFKRIRTSNFIVSGADVGINRLYAHFDRRAEWDYHLYDFHKKIPPCSRSIYTEDGMPYGSERYRAYI